MATASCVGAPDLESGGHSELSCPIGFVAQIPWLPQTGDSVPFTESHFYKNYVCRSDSLDPNAAKTEEINRLALHRILTETFPFYLPARYHTMDAAQMQKCAASPGSYWSNAIHFVRTCSDFGTIPFSNIDSEMNAPRPWIENCFIKNSECKFKDFAKGGPEQCTTAAEFLLEPWVLMQLPFQPALLHQWTVALMAESQKFTKRIQEIRTRGCAPEFYYLLLQLTGLSEKLSDNSIAFCQVFFHHYCCHPTYSLILRINWSYKYHWRLLAETLAALSYALSDECSHVLDCIKRESWGRKLAPSNLKMLSKYKDSDLFDDFTRVYSEKYWLSPQVTNLYKKAESTDSIVSPKAEKLGLAQSVSQEDLKIVQNFVKEVILNGGPLKGLTDPAAFIDNIDTLLGSEKFNLLKSHVIKYQSLADRDSSSPRVEKGGVLLDILRLEADVQREISLGSATKLIWLAAEDFEKDVFLDSNGSASLEDKALDVKDTVEKLLISWTKREETWSRKRLLKRAEATIIKSATSINVSDFQFDSEAVQIFLTMRIRETLLQIYKKMYKTLDSGNFLFYPEAHIIQYILPCFVAMIRDVDNDPQLAKKTKKNYRRLVDEITQSYSVSNALPQDLDSNYRREYFHGRRDYDEYITAHLDKTFHALKAVFKKSSALTNIWSKFQYIGSNFGVALPRWTTKEEKTNSAKPELFVPIDSKIQLSRLLYRLQFDLRLIGLADTHVDDFKIDSLVPTFKCVTKQLPEVEKVFFLLGNELGEMSALQLLKELILQDRYVCQISDFDDVKQLTLPQLYSIAIFMVFKHQLSMREFLSKYEQPLFDLDFYHNIAYKILSGDWWELMVIFNAIMKKAKFRCDPIPFKLAAQNFCCRPLLKALNSSRKKVKMSQPGEVTLCPIQHCGWCGSVNAHPFRLCRECKDEPNYIVQTYFCSEVCEQTALDKCHTEEHAKFVMLKLNLI